MLFRRKEEADIRKFYGPGGFDAIGFLKELDRVYDVKKINKDFVRTVKLAKRKLKAAGKLSKEFEDWEPPEL